MFAVFASSPQKLLADARYQTEADKKKEQPSHVEIALFSAPVLIPDMTLRQRQQGNPSPGSQQGHESLPASAAQRASTATKEASKKVASSILRTIHWDELEHWQRDNHHIHTGYRPASGSFIISFKSLGYVHNETVNIYTHLLPSIASIPFSISLYKAISTRYASATHGDVLAFSSFFAGAAFCLGMSATYHTISNHSPTVARIGNALDYIGIVGLITGSFIPSVYYGFYCMPQLQYIYWTMITLIGAGCSVVSVTPRFRTPAWRPFRAGMFVSMGLSAIFPVLHGLWIFGAQQMVKQIGLVWLVLQGGLYILGATIYAARVPERWRPGQFDILGSSHQIFHVLVVLAAIAHLTGLLRAFDYRHSGLAPLCS